MKRTNLRITILGLNYAPEPSGNAPYTASLAEGLSTRGHTVLVVSGYPHYPEWKLRDGYSGWKSKEVVNGVPVTRLRHYIPRNPSAAMSRLLMELTFGVRLMFAWWGKPDVIIVVSPALFSSALAILRARLGRNRPAIMLWVQDLYSRGVVETSTGGAQLATFAAALESRVLRSADGVTAIHDRFRQHMTESLEVDAGRIRVIRNWTHLPEAPALAPRDIRASLGWAEDDIIVLHAGNMGKKQGLENVVGAARVADLRGSRVRFVLMGDGNQRKRLEALARGASSRLDFVNSLPGHEFQLALAAADALLVNELPGIKDMAVPSKLTSYFDAGVPVIAATDAGSVTAYEMESSGGGLRVDPDAPEALVDAAERLAQDPALAARLAQNGRRYRRENLSEDVAVAKYDDFITSLAQTRRQ